MQQHGMGVVYHDKDSVYTNYAWLRRVLLEEQSRLSYPEHGAKDNPWIESFWGRFKIENENLLLACETLSEVISVVEDRLVYDNEARRHSALDYKRPEEVLLSTLTGGNITEAS
jgi:putative transposase